MKTFKLVITMIALIIFVVLLLPLISGAQTLLSARGDALQAKFQHEKASQIHWSSKSSYETIVSERAQRFPVLTNNPASSEDILRSLANEAGLKVDSFRAFPASKAGELSGVSLSAMAFRLSGSEVQCRSFLSEVVTSRSYIGINKLSLNPDSRNAGMLILEMNVTVLESQT